MANSIPPDIIQLLLSEPPRIAHLATCHDNDPHVAPLWYNYHDGALEIATVGRKLENIEQNNRVAVSIQKDDRGDPLWGVSIQGTATILGNSDVGDETIARINSRYGVEEAAWSENSPVRIDIGTITSWEY